MNNSKINWKFVIILSVVAIVIEILTLPTICNFILPLAMPKYYDAVPGLAFLRWDLIYNNLFAWAIVGAVHLFILAALIGGDGKKKGSLAMDDSGKPMRSSTTEYGSAQLMNEKELFSLYPSYTVDKDNNIVKGEKGKGGIVVCSSLDKKGMMEVTYNDKQEHHCVIGSTGSGKTTNFVAPSMLSIMNSGASMIITDPKGELYINYHEYLKQHGYHIQMLNFTNPSAGQNFNQLEFIKNQYDKGLPYLYESKALRELIKFATYLKCPSKEDAPKLQGYALRILPIDIAAGRKREEQAFEFGELPYVENPNYKGIIKTENGDTVVKYLREVFTRAYELAYKELKKKSGSVIEGNIYLHYRQEQTLKAGIEILKLIDKNYIRKYFQDRIKYYNDFLKAIDKNSSQYVDAQNKISTFNEYLDDIDSRPGYDIDILIRFFTEFENETAAIFQKYEQEAVSNAQSIASMIVESKQVGGTRGESIWIDTPKALLSSLILFTVRESHIDYSQHLGSVYRMLSELGVPSGPKTDKTYLDEIMDTFLPSDAIKLTQTATRIAGDRTKTSILVSTITPMQLWADERVISQSARTSFKVEDIVDEPTVIFLNIPGPDTQPTYTILASLFIEQMYSTLVSYTNHRPDLTLPRPVYFILDEFANMPRIPNFDSKISLARSRNIKFNYIVQSLGQLDQNYKTERETMLGNSNLVYLLTNEFNTAKYISERLGKYTAEIESTSSSSSPDKGVSESSSISKFGRELFNPTELMDKFPKKHGIYVVPRQDPAFVKYCPSYEVPMLEEINNSRVNDLQIERPNEKVNFFSPADTDNYIAAYKLFWNDSILDLFFYRMITAKRKTTKVNTPASSPLTPQQSTFDIAEAIKEAQSNNHNINHDEESSMLKGLEQNETKTNPSKYLDVSHITADSPANVGKESLPKDSVPSVTSNNVNDNQENIAKPKVVRKIDSSFLTVKK